MTPQAIAAFILSEPRLKVREVLTVEVCESLHGWSVRARINFTDRRRSNFEISDHGDTRDAAIDTFIGGLPSWAAAIHR
jgi:hypothetical protein